MNVVVQTEELQDASVGEYRYKGLLIDATTILSRSSFTLQTCGKCIGFPNNLSQIDSMDVNFHRIKRT